jgi:hypothetical protein
MYSNNAPTEAGKPKLSTYIGHTSRQARSTCGITRTALGTFRTICTARTHGGASGATARANATSIFRGSPYHTGMR